MSRRDTIVYSIYNDPKILDEIAVGEFLFLNVGGVTHVLLEQTPLFRENDSRDS
mgnify:CR=1 FL=1